VTSLAGPCTPPLQSVVPATYAVLSFVYDAMCEESGENITSVVSSELACSERCLCPEVESQTHTNLSCAPDAIHQLSGEKETEEI
jgi:hypothetical protein